jgi:hypothetical protein
MSLILIILPCRGKVRESETSGHFGQVNGVYQVPYS